MISDMVQGIVVASRKKFKCLDCGVDTGKIGEHYMLINATWHKVHKSNKGMYCIGCFESRLGRTLNSRDFNNSHVNKPFPGKIISARLYERIHN